jgi:hypothetical protein
MSTAALCACDWHGVSGRSRPYLDICIGLEHVRVRLYGVCIHADMCVSMYVCICMYIHTQTRREGGGDSGWLSLAALDNTAKMVWGMHVCRLYMLTCMRHICMQSSRAWPVSTSTCPLRVVLRTVEKLRDSQRGSRWQSRWEFACLRW